MFVAANNSADVNDKLVGVASDIGAVALTGDVPIPAARRAGRRLARRSG